MLKSYVVLFNLIVDEGVWYFEYLYKKSGWWIFVNKEMLYLKKYNIFEVCRWRNFLFCWFGYCDVNGSVSLCRNYVK